LRHCFADPPSRSRRRTCALSRSCLAIETLKSLPSTCISRNGTSARPPARSDASASLHRRKQAQLNNRPLVEMADIVRCAGQAFIERSRKWINWQHRKVLLAIVRCRTAALGGHPRPLHRLRHTTTISYNSCRNRHCRAARATRAGAGSRRRERELPAHALCPRGLYVAARPGTACPAEQAAHLQPAVPCQR